MAVEVMTAIRHMPNNLARAQFHCALAPVNEHLLCFSLRDRFFWRSYCDYVTA